MGQIKVDFTTLKSLDGYREAFPSVFAGMSAQDASTAVDAVHSSVLEGRVLTTEDMQLCADRILNRRRGGITDEDVRTLLEQNRARTVRATAR